MFLKSHQSALLNKLHTQALAAAATKIQAGWRCHTARKQYLRQRAAVVTLQAGARGMFARQLAAALRRERAATVLQTVWRGRQTCLEYQQLQQATLVLQSMIRSMAARAAYQQMLFLHRSAAATVIQASWRGSAVRQQYKQDTAAVTRLQAAWRAAAARQQHKEMLEQYRLLQRQHEAATCIQRCWRRHQSKPGVTYRHDAAAEAAAVVIQTIWREREQHNSKVRRLQQAVLQYTALHEAVLLVQTAWRCHHSIKQLQKLQHQQRRARFEAQRVMFEQQMAAAMQQQQQEASSSSRRGSRATSDSDNSGTSPRSTWASHHGAMPPPVKAAYGVTFTGLQGLVPGASSRSPESSSSRPQSTTISGYKLRPLPPPPPAAYGVSYGGINSALDPLNTGSKVNQGESVKPRSFKVFQPAPPAAYGVAFAGISGSSSSCGGRSSGGGKSSTSVSPIDSAVTRPRLLEPAPPAAYGIGFSGLQAATESQSLSPATMYRSPSHGSSSSSRLFGRQNSSSSSMGSSGSSSPAGRTIRKHRSAAGYGDDDVESEEAPLLYDVVKGDESALLPPEDRLFQRLGSLVEEKGRVSSLVSGWKARLLTQ